MMVSQQGNNDNGLLNNLLKRSLRMRLANVSTGTLEVLSLESLYERYYTKTMPMDAHGRQLVHQ